MTDLEKFAEDSFASAFRRFPNSSSDDVIQKMYEELHELEDAFLEEGADRHHLSAHCPALTAVEEEWSDVFFALLVFAKCESIDIDKALNIKNEFNKTRL